MLPPVAGDQPRERDGGGNTVTAYTSPDRSTWTARGSRTIAFAAEILVGVAVTSRQPGTLNTAVFEQPTVDSATGM